jgi:H+/Cl- antiporter ClcA
MPDRPAEECALVPAVPPCREELRRPYIPARLGAIILIALIAILFSLGFLLLNGYLEHAIWTENVLAENRWMIPALVLLFSLVVGLSRRYLHAPSAIDAGFVEMVRGDAEPPDYHRFPGAFVSSLASLLSGASIGPEGVLGVLVSEIAEFLRPRLRIPDSAAAGFNLAALASAFNGLIGGVLFTGIFATELRSGQSRTPLQCLVWNLIAGAVGYIVFRAAGFQSFASMVPFPPAGLTPLYVVVAVLCGGLGTGIALGSGIWLQAVEKGMDRLFGGRVVLRAVAAGAVIGAICYVFPDLLFSGESQIQDFTANPALYGAGLLLLLALLKIGLFGISIKAGYIGGPVFPIIFACTLIGLAFNLLIPGIPAAVFVLCIEAGALAVAMGVPLTAIVLVALLSGADQDMIVLLVFSVATGLLFSAEAMKRLQARRAIAEDPTAAGTH